LKVQNFRKGNYLYLIFLILVNMADINEKFDDKIKNLEETIPYLKGEVNCAVLTLTSVLEILSIPELQSFYYNNLAVPLAGGFGGFKSEKGWKGPCGAVCGGCAAIGIIIGGKGKLKFRDHMKTYQKAAIYAHNFEKEFGSVACKELCGTDFSDLNSINEYMENKIWEKQCYKYVVFGVDQVRKLTSSELKRKWQ
jgi:hypothetical protein